MHLCIKDKDIVKWSDIMPEYYGQLSQQDIKKELDKTDEPGLKIITMDNNNEQNLITKHIKYSSFDITPSIVALSAKTGMLETVYQYKKMITNSYYICVKPKDTVLIVSNEYICIPNYISGYVTSRVSNVVKGFGHISTTVDPTWQGALLIALSNPSNQVLKIDVGTPTKKNNDGELNIIDISQTLATVTFHYLNTPYNGNPMEYKSMRMDLLKKMHYKNKNGLRAFFRKKFLSRRRKFTDYFFEYLETNNNLIITEKGWKDFLQEFSTITNKNNNDENIKKIHAYNFIIKENIFIRLKYFYINHKSSIFTVLTVVVIVLLIMLKAKMIDKETFAIIGEIFV